MTLTIFLAILGGIATAAAAIKGIPVLYNGLKNTGKFFGALESVVNIEKLENNQEEMKTSLDNIGDTLKRVEIENKELGSIADLALGFHSSIVGLSNSTVDMTMTAFKAHTSHCEVPSFIISTSEDKVGTFIWANQPWYRLHGIGYTEAKNGQFWDSIAPEDRSRVKSASDMAADSRLEFKVTYTVINQETNERTKVTANSWPLIPYSNTKETQIIYLGGIEIH